MATSDRPTMGDLPKRQKARALDADEDFTASYIEDLAFELSCMASKAGLRESAVLLRYAALEASRGPQEASDGQALSEA